LWVSVSQNEDFHEAPVKHKEEGTDFYHQVDNYQKQRCTKAIVLFVLKTDNHTGEEAVLIEATYGPQKPRNRPDDNGILEYLELFAIDCSPDR
jgi:hypothetical protein